jgi:hypothetical protein
MKLARIETNIYVHKVELHVLMMGNKYMAMHITRVFF